MKKLIGRTELEILLHLYKEGSIKHDDSFIHPDRTYILYLLEDLAKQGFVKKLSNYFAITRDGCLYVANVLQYANERAQLPSGVPTSTSYS